MNSKKEWTANKNKPNISEVKKEQIIQPSQNPENIVVKTNSRQKRQTKKQ